MGSHSAHAMPCHAMFFFFFSRFQGNKREGGERALPLVAAAWLFIAARSRLNALSDPSLFAGWILLSLDAGRRPRGPVDDRRRRVGDRNCDGRPRRSTPRLCAFMLFMKGGARFESLGQNGRLVFVISRMVFVWFFHS